MEIYLVRHGIAEDRSQFQNKNADDRLRPLTSNGIKKFRKMAKSLHRMIGSIDAIVSSPYLRAEQTANILKKHYPKAEYFLSEALSPEVEPNEFGEWSRTHLKKKIKRILVVGHEPHLSQFATWIMFGKSKPCLTVKKGSCLYLKSEGLIRGNSATLEWSVTPKLLEL